MKINVMVSWVLQVVVALTFAQAVIRKVGGDEGTVHVFESLGMEPGGRILVAGLEFAALCLLLIPRTVSWGAILGWGLMTGGIIAHLTSLGIAGAMGPMMIMAAFNWVACIAIILIRRNQVELIRCMFAKDVE